MKILVLGAGLVGSVMAIDLKKNFDVTSADIDIVALEKLERLHNIHTVCTNLAEQGNIKDLVSDYDLVIGAVPGFMGYKTLEAVIKAGKNIVDISFMPEDFLKLDGLAKKNNVTAIVDCGVAPGMGNIILGHHNKEMAVENYECYVGGLPFKREWPYEYKAVFSPIDVIEEYIRPARYVQNYEIVVKDALSEPELMEFEQVGTLEAWNSDGLRSLIKTMNIPNMIEKTLRYPGCIEYLKVLRESGFFSYEEIEINGNKIRPVDVTSKLLFPKWKLQEGEEDFTIMRIIIKGKENGVNKSFIYDLFDRYDNETKTIAMARTTGYTCTAVANLLLEGKWTRKGVLPPEFVGESKGNLTYILRYLAERDVNYKITKL
ncbi:MAG: saccharopine dehydrogenase NADP-binding domain-containing protein [Prolixibacteraceae bacterium]|nr:saccharopine dehydrogenase NADP-binding domain-containing protein [Prolixibacteraceae bacterium]